MSRDHAIALQPGQQSAADCGCVADLLEFSFLCGVHDVGDITDSAAAYGAQELLRGVSGVAVTSAHRVLGAVNGALQQAATVADVSALVIGREFSGVLQVV